jgi:hypothetical protein
MDLDKKKFWDLRFCESSLAAYKSRLEAIPEDCRQARAYVSHRIAWFEERVTLLSLNAKPIPEPISTPVIHSELYN